MCAHCAALPETARSQLARDAIKRELTSSAKGFRADRLSRRIDIGRTIDSVPLSDEAWAWLNLIGHAIVLAQEQARAQDAKKEWFESYADYKAILVAVIAKDINTLGAIFMAMRCEWAHQAAALVRTLCESLITLRYIAQDKTNRSKLFLGYAIIEQYEAVESFLRWDAAHSKPEHVAQMEALRQKLGPQYEAARPTYTFKNKKGKDRPFQNWCNEKIAEMAQKTESERLYRLVYSQTSPYVHASAWSLRAVGAFMARGYDARRALIDTSTLIRAALVVWFEWAVFCDQELGWKLQAGLGELKERLDELQAALDATTASSDA